MELPTTTTPAHVATPHAPYQVDTFAQPPSVYVLPYHHAPLRMVHLQMLNHANAVYKHALQRPV